MITAPDFKKKQIAFVLFNEGEKLTFNNDNFTVKTEDGKIKFQCSCYRLFAVFVVGHCAITSALIQSAKKFGYFIVLMTSSYRVYSFLGAIKEGNTLLRKKQYEYNDLCIAKHIIKNKIQNQANLLIKSRNKSDSIKDAVVALECYSNEISSVNTLGEIMAYEGLSSKIYFQNCFNNVLWSGRQPRVKCDYVNAILDIGYTLLFSFVDALLCSYGFDTYCGVLHRQFYMRKSLVCDIVEPFRPLIDVEIKKAINLREFQENDFDIVNLQYRLNWKNSTKYIKVLMNPIIENKDAIFAYVQSYYRAFMKDAPISDYPTFFI